MPEQFDMSEKCTPEFGIMVLSGYSHGAVVATNRLLMENSDGILLEDSSGDLQLES